MPHIVIVIIVVVLREDHKVMMLRIPCPVICAVAVILCHGREY